MRISDLSSDLCSSDLVGIGGALVYSLQLHRADKPNEELYSTTSRSTPDGLNSLPRDYTGPLLGPPLPGDLGRPILNAQNSGQPVPNPSIASPSDPKSTRLNSSH